ncbi:cytochrome c [Cyclobacterium amurskyense]|jgi:mono/diheme cytochrome c family protein|uniref:c-type cytochrome n=1 Tax=Cyclobacterium amurskyense TaxID=320787 RepID=UPI0030DD25A8|tara:strand:- start:24338 stop:24784 length:447 start_codon:yes stop_codon:yes gene_type:complete
MRAAIGSLLLILFTSCQSTDSNSQNGIDKINDLKTKQYAIQGQQLYLQHCSNCHQEDGTGLNRLIPPLSKADYMITDVGRSLYIIRNGLKGSIMVNDIEYNQPMPGNSNLTPLEIAQISTYIYNVWGNEHGLITTEEVNKALAQKPKL